METAHVVLETIQEKEEVAPAQVTSRNLNVATWPRTRQTSSDRRPIADFAMECILPDFSVSTSNGLDSEVSKSCSVETGLSSLTTDNSLLKISEQAVRNVDKGTQTDCDIVEVHAAPREGRLKDIICVHQCTLYLL